PSLAMPLPCTFLQQPLIRASWDPWGWSEFVAMFSRRGNCTRALKRFEKRKAPWHQPIGQLSAQDRN
ncbi:MAG TPA: hypothetical protein VHG30_15085, partial [Microvirga sp.]|nr:hypothetical protein [Microvirga sp.]